MIDAATGGSLLPILSTAFVWAFTASLALLVVLGLFAAFAYFKFRRRKYRELENKEGTTVAFFHPYCDAGGGGERVLWCGIRALRRRFQGIRRIVVFTGDVQSAPDQILDGASRRFQISQADLGLVEFVYLHKRRWVHESMWPRFTLLGQTLGSLILGWEALTKVCPDVYLDTMGYAFTLPLFKYVGRCKVGCYVHYPTISTDMLELVRKRKATYNNRSSVTNSKVFSWLKLAYYKMFARMYGWAGSCSDLTMVNSSWTEDHIVQLWSSPTMHPTTPSKSSGQELSELSSPPPATTRSTKVHKVYPPCDVSEFASIPRGLKGGADGVNIVSVGQFRPEKDHAMQIRTMFELRRILAENEWAKLKLVIIGGCRNEEDQKRVKDLRDLCCHLSVEDNVEFKINIPFQELKDEMGSALIGLHTMWNEHFGIAVVEMMAAGLVTVAHRSGGPLMDIVIEEAAVRNGFLAANEQEYASTIKHILNDLTPEEVEGIRDRARDSVKRFSDDQFESGWLRTTSSLIDP